MARAKGSLTDETSMTLDELRNACLPWAQTKRWWPSTPGTDDVVKAVACLDLAGSAEGAATEGLTSYTNADIARQEAAQRAATVEAERTQREADQKAQADAERDSFTLTGSDRAADAQAAQGQGDIFDQPTAESTPANRKEAAPSPLEALFSDLNSDSARKANKARRAAAKLPQAARIDYVQANFHDILIQMMESGSLEVNGATTLTEDNKPCL